MTDLASYSKPGSGNVRGTEPLASTTLEAVKVSVSIPAEIRTW